MTSESEGPGEHVAASPTDARPAMRPPMPPIWRGLSLESLPLGGVSRRAIAVIAAAFVLVVLAVILQLTVLR